MTLEEVCLYLMSFHDKYLFELNSMLKKYSYILSREDTIRVLQNLINKGLVKIVEQNDSKRNNITDLLDYDLDSIIFDLTTKGKRKAEKLESIEHRRQEHENYQNIIELIDDLKRYNEIKIFAKLIEQIDDSYRLVKRGENIEVISYYTDESETILPINDLGELIVRDNIKLKDVISKFTVWYKIR